MRLEYVGNEPAEAGVTSGIGAGARYFMIAAPDPARRDSGASQASFFRLSPVSLARVAVRGT